LFSGEKTYQLKTENVHAEVIINPCYLTAVRRIQSFLFANCGYRFLLHAGLVFKETGNWILQDGALAFSAFSGLFRSSPSNGTGPIDLTVSILGEWNLRNLSSLISGSRVRVPGRPAECVAENLADDLRKLAEEVSRQLEPATVVENLTATDVIGSVSFARPTMYIFPGGHGSSSLLSVNGFNILVDGGFGRRCCFWSLVSHLEVIDAVLLTSLPEENVLGIAAFLERKVLEDVHPRIGTVFLNARCTAGDAAHLVTDGGVELCVSLVEASVAVLERLRTLNIQPHQCFVSSHRNNQINLYHLIGRGSLDMHILSPVAHSRQWKEFVDQKSASEISVCAAVVFQPAAAGTRPTRVLFCGSCTQSKIFAGCDRLKTHHLFQSVSGLPEERPSRLSSVSTQEKMLVVPASKPRIPSVGSVSPAGRSSEAKKFTVVRVKEPTSGVVSSGAERPTVKTVSMPKPTHRTDTSKKPTKMPLRGDSDVKPQSFAKEIRQPVTGKDGSRPSHDLKGSISAGPARGASAKPCASKSEAAVGTKPVMSMKSKKPDTSGRSKVLTKHGSEPQATVSKAAAGQLDTAIDKTGETVEETAATAAESNVDEHYMEAGAASHQQQSGVSDTLTAESADAELPAEMDAPLHDAEISTKHEPVNAATAAELAEPDGVSCVVSVSKAEPEVDVDEKDVDTAETEIDGLAGEVMSGAGENRCDDTAATDRPLDVDEVEENDGHGKEQSSSDTEGDTATNATPDQPDTLQLNDKRASPEVGRGSGNAESTSIEISDGNADEYVTLCAGHDDAHLTETCQLKDAEPMISSTLTADDAGSKGDEGQSVAEPAEVDVERTPSVDEDGSVSKAAETQQDVAAEMDIGVQDPTATDECDVPGTEEPASAVDGGNCEMPHSDFNGDGKPFEEISRDNVTDEGFGVLAAEEKRAADLAADGSSPSKVLEGNADGKPVGEGLHADGLSKFDPQRDWESPQSLPAPARGNDEKPAVGTSSSAAAATKKSTGTFKVPAPKPKKAATHRDDLNLTDTVAASRSVRSGTSGRLSLQPGDLKLLSPVRPRKTSHEPVVPFYVDMVSLPVSASGTCTVDVDFFRRIRARYYVINSAAPDPRVLDLLAEAKATWEGPVGPVTIIPTGNPTLLLEWYSTHQERMTALQISVSCSASQCAVEMQGCRCSAYRLEF